MTVMIDRLRDEDLLAGHALSTTVGWNQTPADWRRLLRLEPAGCFCARVDGRVVGTATTTIYGSVMAWIGMVIVHQDFRRRGIGAALMNRALEHIAAVGVSCVKLD